MGKKALHISSNPKKVTNFLEVDNPSNIATNYSIANNYLYPVQRVIQGNPQSMIHTPARLNHDAQQRLDNVVETLVNTLHTNQLIQINQLIISIEREGGPDLAGVPSTIVGDNPAQTLSTPNGSIQITIQRPFAEVATEGEMLGLLAHEVGVHNIPSDFIPGGVNDQAEMHFANIGEHAFDNFQNNDDRQHDHLMVADILRNPPPGNVAPIPIDNRARIYFKTFIDIGDTIAVNEGPEEREEKINELIHIYLVDIARIIATDDSRKSPLRNAVGISDLYAQIFEEVVLPQRGAHVWIPEHPPKGSIFSLGVSLAYFLLKVKFEKWRNG